MQSNFVSVICQMGIFVICAQAIVHFRPKASYERYLKMLVSIMLAMQLFLLVGDVFSTDVEQLFGEWAKTNFLFEKEELELQLMGNAPEITEGEQTVVEVPQIRVWIAPVEKICVGVE